MKKNKTLCGISMGDNRIRLMENATTTINRMILVSNKGRCTILTSSKRLHWVSLNHGATSHYSSQCLFPFYLEFTWQHLYSTYLCIVYIYIYIQEILGISFQYISVRMFIPISNGPFFYSSLVGVIRRYPHVWIGTQCRTRKLGNPMDRWGSWGVSAVVQKRSPAENSHSNGKVW